MDLSPHPTPDDETLVQAQRTVAMIEALLPDPPVSIGPFEIDDEDGQAVAPICTPKVWGHVKVYSGWAGYGPAESGAVPGDQVSLDASFAGNVTYNGRVYEIRSGGLDMYADVGHVIVGGFSGNALTPGGGHPRLATNAAINDVVSIAVSRLVEGLTADDLSFLHRCVIRASELAKVISNAKATLAGLQGLCAGDHAYNSALAELVAASR